MHLSPVVTPRRRVSGTDTFGTTVFRREPGSGSKDSSRVARMTTLMQIIELVVPDSMRRLMIFSPFSFESGFFPWVYFSWRPELVIPLCVNSEQELFEIGINQVSGFFQPSESLLQVAGYHYSECLSLKLSHATKMQNAVFPDGFQRVTE